MKVSLWAEIRRLHEIERFTARAIAARLGCCRKTVRRALALGQPPLSGFSPRASKLDPYHPRIEALIARYPVLSAVRVLEEISRGPDGYRGEISMVRRHLRKIRPARGRVYQEVCHEPGEAMQVDWGECGRVQVGQTWRKVSVFVAVLCYSRLLFIEFTLSQRKAEFYRALTASLKFFGGSPRKVIVDNLKAAVLNGSGRQACFHPEFLALCGHFYLQPVACQRRDPESKGVVEGAVRYIKRNALAGRTEQLATFEDYLALAATWRDTVANVRLHETTRQSPLERFETERPRLRALPGAVFDTDEMVPAVASPHARVEFDGNRYSVPPRFVRKTVCVRADRTHVRVLSEGIEIACHARCYEKRRLLVLPDHHLAALELRKRAGASRLEQEFDGLGPEARAFHLALEGRPVKTGVHLGRLLRLARLYGRQDVCAALRRALELNTYDAAYVEHLLLADRRRQQLPSPTVPCPKRRELIDDIQSDEPDPSRYDRLLDSSEGDPS